MLRAKREIRVLLRCAPPAEQFHIMITKLYLMLIEKDGNWKRVKIHSLINSSRYLSSD